MPKKSPSPKPASGKSAAKTSVGKSARSKATAPPVSKPVTRRVAKQPAARKPAARKPAAQPVPPATTSSVRSLFLQMYGVDQLDFSSRVTLHNSSPVLLSSDTRNDD